MCKTDLIRITQPATADVVIALLREPVFDHSGMPVLDGAGNVITTPVTNVPWSVVSHRPSGFEWGYGGSGPADLALNILNWFVPPGTDSDDVDCFYGTCSFLAWHAHQARKLQDP